MLISALGGRMYDTNDVVTTTVRKIVMEMVSLKWSSAVLGFGPDDQ